MVDKRGEPQVVIMGIKDFKGKAKTFPPKQKLSITRDPGDNKFLECAQTVSLVVLVDQ
ncbi:hypothetical protein MYX84_08855 [Acidobacteria bacterium AH-259-O06]|nr:hypothetical protein [Acidobacteria bacterium AH-259-O06]